MTKTIHVRIAGQERYELVPITETTTAEEVLRMAGCPPESYELTPGVGLPTFGKDERIFSRVKDGGKVIASAPADAGETRN